MDDPKQAIPRQRPWHPITWAFIGLAVGTLIVSPLVLSSDPRERARGGMIFGGVPGAVLGLAYGLGRRNKFRQS